MKNTSKIIVISAIVILLIIGVWYFYPKDKNDSQGAETINPETSSSAGDTNFVQINIQSYSFKPNSITIQKGTTVIWTNLDNVQHTATSDDGLFNSGYLSKGISWNYTFNEAGTYGYYCIPHPSMTGKIVVE